MNEEIYVQVTGRMIYYDRIYRKKYKISNPNPETNKTVEGVSDAYKYDDSMKQQRKGVLDKYGVTSEQFEGYSDMIDDASAAPEGHRRRQALLDRAAQVANALAGK